jgi:predicted Rossmann fold flavoprotein
MSHMQKLWDVIIIGAGAAGLFCASQAAQRGKKVLLLEHMPQPGKKILISGGGRCNFTNMYASPENYLSENPHFCKSALARYTPWDFIDLILQYDIPYHEKKLGQLFCDRSAQDIVDMLLKECQKSGVKLITGIKAEDVSQDESGFKVHTPGQIFQSKKLVLSSGGLSIPKIGATGFGYRILKKFDHPLVQTRPALVPLTAGTEDKALLALRGIAVDSEIRYNNHSFRENLLFTHFGLSGPAILQISSYWQEGSPLSINFLPESQQYHQLFTPESDDNSTLYQRLKQAFPKRFAQHWKEHYSDLEQALTHWEFKPSGTSGYAKAEVTAGGANTDFFSSQTMESKKVNGLYCIGELMDVTGWLGGYNFQWAWASAFACAQAL